MDTQPVINKVVDAEGRRTQVDFVRFIRRYQFLFALIYHYFSFGNDEGKKIYLDKIMELRSPERNTLLVDFLHINDHSAVLASVIELHFYRYNR